ncbi:DNA/RNA non-specific endonuclease [Kitasatospora sp. NPDC048239]|uniref:DNA/RNA non-specific endonuclease n=1 Tax=Kitasatospora sp. NPDC048239 TaxID=3364046 RepID=UPI003721C291
MLNPHNQTSTHILGSEVEWPIENPDLLPPGFALGSGLNRGHLLARQLCGIGTDRRNLVPLYSLVNTSAMKRYENRVKKAVDSGETVYYAVRPTYDGDNPMPTSIVLMAWGDRNARFVARIPNVR